MTDRIVVIVQARTGSCRLPGKSLRPLAGRPMIQHVLQRVGAMGYPVWLATSVNGHDDNLAAVGEKSGCSVHRGSEWDVLRRVADTARLAGASVIVRVTGDCPLWAPDVGARVLQLYRDCGASGYASNDTMRSGWPDGLDVEVFAAELLYQADERVISRLGDPRDRPDHWPDREHVTPWIRRNAPCVTLQSEEDWRGVKLSVDCAEDFARVQGVLTYARDGDLMWAATRAAYLRWKERP